jgi:DNA-binding NarL/FixJ family response regulator
MKAQIKVAMAEDHVLLRHGMISMLKEYKDIKIVFDVNNGLELMRELEMKTPDIILLDIDMPVIGGKEALDRINAEYPDIKVIMLTEHFSESFIIEFVRNGAKAFLPKNCDIDKIIEAINAVHMTGHYYHNGVSEILAKHLSMGRKQNLRNTGIKFTQRELEIMELLRQNKNNTDVSEILGIRARTVEWHRQNLMQKTGCKNLVSLISYAIQYNLILQIPVLLSKKPGNFTW